MAAKQILRVMPPMTPIDRLRTAAKVLNLEGVDMQVAAFTAECILYFLLKPGQAIEPSPAELVNSLHGWIWTHFREITADEADATVETYRSLDSIARAVRCFYDDKRYEEEFRRLWRDRIQSGQAVTNEN